MNCGVPEQLRSCAWPRAATAKNASARENRGTAPRSNRIPPAFSRREARLGEPAEVYGLLTVLPTAAEPGGQQHRTLIVSGVSNVGIQGAMEFFTSAERLQELKTRFRRDGLVGFPKSYQLVVRCTAQDSLPLSCDYEFHLVLEP